MAGSLETGWVEASFARRVLARLLSPHVLRFGVVGLTGVVVNLGSLYVLSELIKVPDLPWFQVKDVTSSALAIEISILWNFFLNNAWTFRDRNARARVGIGQRMLRYNLISLVGLGIQLVTFAILTSTFTRVLGLEQPGAWKYLAQLCGIAIAMGWNFVSNFFWTWAQHDDPVRSDSGSSGEA